jgi:hypothetical protein
VALSVCSCKQEPDNKEEIFRKEEVVAVIVPFKVLRWALFIAQNLRFGLVGKLEFMN